MMEKYYDSIIEKKEGLVRDGLGIEPCKALSFSSDEYDTIPAYKKYKLLLSFCKEHGLVKRKRRRDIADKDIEDYKFFLNNAPENEVERIIAIVLQANENTRKRKSFNDRIKQKRKEIGELQKMIKRLK